MPTTSSSTTRIELIARLAWHTAFVVPLLLAVVLLGASGAGATPADQLPPAPRALEAEPEEEEEGLSYCDLAQAEFEEGWLTENELKAVCVEEEVEAGTTAGAPAATECPLRRASAHAVTKHNKLKLTIGYTTNFQAKAAIQLYAGQTRVATYKRQLGRSGVLRFSKSLSGSQLRKRFHVRLKLQEGDAGCPSRRLVLFPR